MADREKEKYSFDFAISYAGEEEGIATDLSWLLSEKGAVVFFASNEKAYLLGKSLESELTHIFGPRTRFAVPLVSRHYVEKYWPKSEFRIALKEALNRGFEVILPVLIDDVRLPGLEEDIVYIDLRKEGLLSTVETMITKLHAMLSREDGLLVVPYTLPGKQPPEAREYVHSLVPSASQPERRPVPKYWVIALGLDIEASVDFSLLPASAPTDYPHLCDWLENDLMERLSHSPFGIPIILEDFRDGEGLSIRIGIEWDPRKGPLKLGDTGVWEVLEIEDFADVYPDQDPREALGKKQDTE